MLLGAHATDRDASSYGRIVRTPHVCCGRYRFAQTRIHVLTIRSALDYWDTPMILEQWPSLTSADVEAARRWRAKT